MPSADRELLLFDFQTTHDPADIPGDENRGLISSIFEAKAG
jgi:hypothetical protein